MFDDIFNEIKNLQKDIDKSFGDFFQNDSYKFLPNYTNEKGITKFRNPITELEENENELIAKFELPGVDKKDIQLNISDRRIEVKVEKEEESKVKKKDFFKEEKVYKGFYKMISLPVEVIKDKIKAKYKDGVLEVIMPKVETKNKKVEIE